MKSKIILKKAIQIGRAELTLIEVWRGYAYFEGVLTLTRYNTCKVNLMCEVPKGIRPFELGEEFEIKVISCSPEITHEIARVEGKIVV